MNRKTVTGTHKSPRPDSSISHPDHQMLFEIAADQGGYFTTAQARQAGFSKYLLHHHVRRGRFRPAKLRRGLYRLRDFPTGLHEEFWEALVSEGPDAVLSHESALRLHKLSNVSPRVVHLWVPYSRRPRHQDTSKLRRTKLHVTRKWLEPDESTLVDGLRVTTPLRTILDVAESGTSPDQVVAAIKQALERGWATPEQLKNSARARGSLVATRADRYLQEALE